MRYIFAKNVNKTKNNGIIDLKTNKLVCLCDEENSKLLVDALDTYNQNKAGDQVTEIKYYLIIQELVKDKKISDAKKCSILLQSGVLNAFGIEFDWDTTETNTSRLEKFMKILDAYMNEYYPLI